MKYPLEKYRLPTDYQTFISASRYSRWIEEEGRREIWPEPAVRYVEKAVRPVLEKAGCGNVDETCMWLFEMIASTKVMPSMRMLMTAGEALDRDHMAGYNCSFVCIDHPRAFDEILYILTCGTGVGFSCEQKFVNKLPEIAEELHDTDTTIVVGDSRIGWASSFRELISLLYSGKVPRVDVSRVRPKGARLKVFGGRASGPAPLVDLFDHCIRLFRAARGRRLTSIEVHSIVCKIGEIVVVGGVRRCLKEGTVVHTQNGPARIETLLPGEMVKTATGFKPVVATECTGDKSIYEIYTRCGVVESTGEHRHAVIRSVSPFRYEWIETKNITDLDTLAFFTDSNDGAAGKPLTPFSDVKLHFNAKPYNRPTHMSTDLAWLLGALCDGSCVERGVIFTQRESNVEFLNKAQRISREIFGVESDLTQGHNTLDLKLWRRQLSRDLRRYKSKRSGQLIHPDILSASRQEKLAFIAGVLDADGTLKTTPEEREKGTVNFRFACSIDKDWIFDLSRLIGTLGIPTRVFVQGRGDDASRSPMWRVQLSDKDFANAVADELRPYSIKVEKDFVTSGTRDGSAHALVVTRSGHNTPRVMNAMDYRSFDWPVGVVPAKVEKILYQGEDTTYDIQVADDECFVANGHLTHNSALISLSDLLDPRMRAAKSGAWWEKHPEFALANNSAVFEEKPEVGVFLEEWKALYDSKSGERGIYNRDGIRRKTKAAGKREENQVVGTNPCGEIALRSAGLCNLSTMVIRPDDTFESLREKAKAAAIIGTIQSTYTNFRYVRPIWKRNAEEERLLGVSQCGIYDHVSLSSIDYDGHEDLREYVVQVNAEWANKLGINPSVATTTVKPEGTVSQKVDAASGIHPRHAPFYIRSVRGDNKDPMTQFLKDQGVPWEPCVMKPDSTTVFFFPIKAPEGAATRKDVSAIDHLELWKHYNKHWSEHQVSVTVTVKEHEWVDVAAWVYKNFDEITGVSFLPEDGGTYRQAPYQECTEEEYEAHLAKMPVIDWTKLSQYELEDQTTGARELACTAGHCEIL